VKVIAVTGTGSGSGKTSFVVRLLRAIPGLGAVKISPRPGATSVEWGTGSAGEGKDTARYLAAGAVRAARIIGPRGSAGQVWKDVELGMAGCRAVVVEGSGALEIGQPRLGILVAGGHEASERPERLGMILSKVDLVLINDPTLEGDLGLMDIILLHNVRTAKVHFLDIEHGSEDQLRPVIGACSEFVERMRSGA
jgi:hypothetical protein